MLGGIFVGIAGALSIVVAAVMLQRTLRRRGVRRANALPGPNAIDDSRFIRIGGIDQWISLRGEDRENPVILFLHGGPGSSYSMFTPLLRAWEKHFTLVQWDQRGAGKTFGRNGKHGSGEMTLDRMVDDAVEVTEAVRSCLGKEKIIVLASSMGTLLGLRLVKQRPDLFSAYVGTDQNVAMGRNDATFQATVERLRAAGLAKGVAALEKIGPDPTRWTTREWSEVAQWIMRSDPVQGKATMKLLSGSLWGSPEHSLRDIFHFSAGMRFSLERLFPGFLSFDARALGLDFAIPFFLFQGANDLHTPAHLAVAYFEEVRAPVKALKILEDTGHFAAFMQPDRFLTELLARVRPLALAAGELAPGAPGPRSTAARERV